MLSFAIPGTVLGVAYILAFNVPPIEITGTGLILMPQATRIWRDAAQRLVRFCAVISLAYTLSAALWGAMLLIALPRGLGQWLLGAIWQPAYPLVLPTAVGIMGFCVAAGAGTGLKGAGAAKHGLRAAIATSIMYVLFSLTGAFTAGSLGAVWGTALALWCGAFVYWWQFVVAIRESEEPVPRVSASAGARSASGS